MHDDRPTAARIAIIGVGLIGGSLGLAAREMIPGIESVIGFGSRQATLDKALQLGAITEIAGSIEEAVRDAEIIVLAGPVSTLADGARAALAAAGPDAVVTDVGSTKRQIVSAIDDARFIGGHPIAGAETAGVEHARADLFQDATWFVTPTEQTTGMGLERLLRFIGALGARPHMLDAETHDRLLADISHLPHVLANALVTQAAQSLNDSDRSVSVFGPSFRDATRVAGANSAIWRDIYLSNHDALVPAIDSVISRLSEFRDALEKGDGDEIVRLNEAARSDRQSLLERDLVGGAVCELRVSVPNSPGILAQITLALGRAGVNIVDMALYPAADMRSGAVSLWVGGNEAAEKTEELIAELGFPVARA
jgi:prephenate dehydrogenase